MTDTEWFRIKKDPDAPIANVTGLDRKNFPYFTDAETFAKADDVVVHYEQETFLACDILFEPTFLINDRLQPLFKLLEPAIAYKGVQIYRKFKPEAAPRPLYWLPYLPFTDAISSDSQIVQGKATKLVVKRESLREKRVAHCRLPADDIWLLSLEAAECFLRREPLGVVLEKVFSQS